MTYSILFSTTKRLVVMVFALAYLSGCTVTNSLNAPGPFEIPSPRYAAIVINSKTGKVLHATRPDAVRFPASLTKMMTMYMIFDALRSGRLKPTSEIPVSTRAARQPASKLYLKAGSTITLDTALRALAVKSANDVAYAVAEHLGGSKARFAAQMTAKARVLGMRATTFRNPSGLPDKKQVTTARDMAKLGMALRRHYPQYFHYFGLRSFEYNGRTIRGHNRVLGMLDGADGIKTGYTRASGFNLVTSVKTSRGVIVGVILGENSGRTRDKHMVQLIERYKR